MRHFLQTEARRRGAVIPLFAILLIPLMGMLAFSIDIGYIALVRTDLQTAADAAALAGAEKLQALYVQYTSPGQLNQNTILTTATTNTPGSPMNTAEKFASYNKAGNVSITVRDQDVTFSFMDSNGNFQQNYWANGLTGGFPNSITVITRRDSVQNTPVSLFFGPIFGVSTKELTAKATATIYSGDVTSLQVIQGVTGLSSVRPHILPLALDYNVWTKFYTSGGLSPDGTIHLAANGSPQLYVYQMGPQTPNYGVPFNTAGSFGPSGTGSIMVKPRMTLPTWSTTVLCRSQTRARSSGRPDLALQARSRTISTIKWVCRISSRCSSLRSRRRAGRPCPPAPPCIIKLGPAPDRTSPTRLSDSRAWLFRKPMGVVPT